MCCRALRFETDLHLRNIRASEWSEHAIVHLANMKRLVQEAGEQLGLVMNKNASHLCKGRVCE